MKLNLIPQRRDDSLTIYKDGDVLTINGEVYDFSPLTPGGKLPASAILIPWVVGDVTRTQAGQLEISLLFPHGAGASEAARFPVPIIDPADGFLELPK